jgi:Mn-containing catalase
VQSEVEGGKGLTVTPYDPEPGTETTSPFDSTPVGEYTNGGGSKPNHKRIGKRHKASA